MYLLQHTPNVSIAACKLVLIHHSYDGLILVAMRAVVAILPIVCSLFISNLVYILKYGGLVGFLTVFFFPLALQLASQYVC